MPNGQEKNEILSAFGLAPQVKEEKKPIRRNVILDAFFQQPPTDVVPPPTVAPAQVVQPPQRIRPEIELPGFQVAEPVSTRVEPRPAGLPRAETILEKALTKPLIGVSQFIPDPDDPKNAALVESFFVGTPMAGASKTVKKVVFGGLKGGVQALEGLTTATNIALLVGTSGFSAVIKPFVSIAFAGHMGYGLGKEFNALKEEFTTAVESGNYGKAAQIATNTLATVGFITGATVHGGKGFAENLVTRKTGKITGELLPKEIIPEKLPPTVKRAVKAEEPIKPLEKVILVKPKPKEKTVQMPFIEKPLEPAPKIPVIPKVKGTKEAITVKGEKEILKESERMYFVDPAVLEVGEKLTSIQKAITGQPTSEINAFAREAVTVRTGKLRVEQFKTKRFVDKGNKEFTATELEDMIFDIEKTGNVFREGDTHANLSERLSPKAKQFVKLVQNRFDKMRKTVNESGWSQEVAFVENYITHLYTGKNLKKVSGDLARKWVTKNPFVKQRTYETFQKAIQEQGLIPRYKRVTDYLQYYENMSNLVIANNRLMKTLAAEKTPDGVGLIARPGTAPADYVEIDHVAFNRIFVTGEGKPIQFKMKVHPEIEQPLRRIFDEGLQFHGILGSILNNYRIINALSKQTMLTFSFFHHLALGESGVASGRFPITAYRKGAKYLKDEQITGKAIEAGLQLNATADVHKLILDELLIGWERKARGIPGLRQVTTAMRWSKQQWDVFLWDKIHSYLKMDAWYRKYTRDLIKHGDEFPEKVIARDAASYVNDAFGGQNWDAFFRSSKKLEGMAHLSFLAPDWGISNVRIASRGVGVGIKIATLGKVQLGRPTQINSAGWYWLRAGLMFTVGLDALQWLGLKAAGLDPHHIWENDPGHKFSVELPWRDDKGRKKYVKPLKQAREVLRYMTNPLEIIGSKLAPNVRLLIEQFTGHSPGSGFKQPFADMEFWESVPTRIKHSIFMVTPLSVKSGGKITLPFPLDKSGQNFLFSLPASTGMNNFKTTKYFSNTLRAWAEKKRFITKLGRPLSEEEVIESLGEIARASSENNLDTKRLLSLSLSQLRTTYYGEFFSALNRDKMEEAEKWAEALTRLNATNANMNDAIKNRFDKILQEGTDLTPKEIFEKRKKAKEIFKSKRKKTAVEIFIKSVK